MKQHCTILYLMLSAVMLLTGCRSEPEIILHDPSTGHDEPAAETESEEAAWENMLPESTADNYTRPHYIEPNDAKEAPALQVSTLSGAPRTIRPGRPDSVTIVLFWSIDASLTKAALRHVDYLVKRYGVYGLRGVAIAEKTAGYREIPEFLREARINLPVYLDQFTALKTLGKSAGIKVNREIPSFFMIGPDMKTRFFKRGFSYTSATRGSFTSSAIAVIENAPPGERIEDYVRRLLTPLREGENRQD